MNIPFNVLDRQYLKYQSEYENKVLETLRKGWYVLGPEVENFEKEYAESLGTKYVTGVDMD